MRWYDCLPTHIWSSPLIRAVQTAELVAASMQSKIAVEIVSGLAPADDATELVVAIRGLAPVAAVMLVGHEPMLSGIGALLVDSCAISPSGLATAEAVRIVDGTVRWRFAWDADAPSKELRHVGDRQGSTS